MSRPPRIDALITGLDVGGAEHQLVRLSSALQERGWVVRVISIIEPGAIGRLIEKAGVPLYDLRVGRGRIDPRGLMRLARMLRRQQPDVLLSFLYHANVLGRLAGRLAGVPLIVSSLRNEHFGSPRRDALLRLTDALGHVNTTNSERAAAGLRQRGLVPHRDISVIPNAIDADHFRARPGTRAQVRQALGIDPSTFVWLMVASMTTQKNHAAALHAFQEHSADDALLLLAGDGHLAPELRQLATSLGIDDRVRFLGIREDVPELLAAADAFLLSSAWEGLPNVVLEAFAAGLPVVATDVGGVGELVRDGITGVLVSTCEASAIAGGMRRLSAMTPDERRAMTLAAGRLVLEDYDVARVIDRWEALLRAGRKA